MKMFFRKGFALLALLLSATLAGCTSGLETEPVNLPVPFSGALTPDTQIVISNGPPLHEGILFGHPSGDQWELQNSSGRSVGVVTFLLDTASDPIEDVNGRASFTMSVALDFDDSSSVTAEGVQFFDYPFDAPPDFNLADAVPSEPDAQAVMRKGIASGRIVEGTGRFSDTVGENVDHRYLYGDVQHADGFRTFFKHNFSTWLIHGTSGSLSPGKPAIGSKVLAALFLNGPEYTELPGGVYKLPLFCEGDVICGEYTESNYRFAVSSDGSHVEVTDTSTVCKEGSCVTTYNTLYVADFVPELVGAVTGGAPYQTTMTQHDPIQCGDATGIFSAAACAGKLKLDYRCLSVIDLRTFSPVTTLAGSFIISTTP